MGNTDRFWRLALGILFFGLCGWLSTTPLYAHHTISSAANSVVGSVVDSVNEATIALPPNFIAKTVVSGLTLPTDMVILPSGDFLVAEKGTGSGAFSHAQVRLVRGGVLLPDPVVTIGVNSREDSGLLGIIIDPQFAMNHYFYLWYSTGEDSLGWAGTSNNRLSRFVFDEVSGTANPASETIILDNIRWAGLHNGGGLVFDNQGNLLISTGDAGNNINFPDKHVAQSLQSLSGKVLRIRPRAEGGYDIPSDNPYVDIEGALPEIYALGLRNPFRIARRAADQKIVVLDVGENTWEEVNLLTPTANYGWPYREGRCAIFEREPECTPNPGQFTDPTLVYLHPNGLGAGITAMSFYEGEEWPAEYRGRLFFADFNSEWIGMFNLDLPDSNFTQFGTEVGALVDMEATNEGIYAVSIFDQSIKFIYYDEDGNHPPVAEFATSVVSGKSPLTVTFTATAEDPDGDEVEYHWDFGDGVKVSAPQPTSTHVYTQDGTYLATLQVTDEEDGESEIRSQVIQVYSGEMAEIFLENLSEAGRLLYNGGDELRFHAMRTGGTAGLDESEPYVWTILLHHNEHEHILIAEYASEFVDLEIPLHSHALGAILWYEVQLAMRTDSGQILRTTYQLQPQTTTIEVESWPGQTVLKIDQQRKLPDELTTVIVGQEYTLEAPAAMIYQGQVGQFKNWIVADSWPVVDTAGATQIIADRIYTVTITTDPKTYIAFYEYSGVANVSFLPSVNNSRVISATIPSNNEAKIESSIELNTELSDENMR